MFVANRTRNAEIQIETQIDIDDNIDFKPKDEELDSPSTFASANVGEETYWKKRCEELTDLLTKSENECEELRKAMKRREELFNRIIIKSYKSGKLLKERLRKVREENRTYEKVKVRLKKIFNEDQIKALTNPGLKCQWSEETTKRALRLWLACGNAGYQQILDENIPLPSCRTLRRKLNNVELDED